MIRYASVKAPDAPLRARLHELARDRLTFGYPRLHVLLRREGWTVNRKRVYRLYREEGLSLTRKRPRRRKAAMVRPVRPTTVAANQRWAVDFMHDVLASGQKIRVFTPATPDKVLSKMQHVAIALSSSHRSCSVALCGALYDE